MHVHRNASRDKSKCSNEKSIKTRRHASRPYVPLPMFAGGKGLRGVVSVPQFATLCRQMPHKCHLPTKMQHTAAICRILHFLLTDSPYFFSSRRRHSRLQGDWSSDVCSSD